MTKEERNKLWADYRKAANAVRKARDRYHDLIQEQLKASTELRDLEAACKAAQDAAVDSGEEEE